MQTGEIDLKELVGILRRQGRLILLTFVVLMLPVILYLIVATPMYRATALISIEAAGSNLLDPGSVENSQSAILNSRVDGEVEILRADSTVQAVVERSNLIRDPEFGPRLGMSDKIALALGIDSLGDRLRQAVGLRPRGAPDGAELVTATMDRLKDATDIRRRGLTYLIAVSVESETPQRAADIANSYVATYIDRQVLTKSESVFAARDVLQRQTVTAQEELTRLEDALNGFIDDNLARLEQESKSEAISALRRQLETARSAKEQSVAALASSREAAARNDWAAAASTLGDAALDQLARERQAIIGRLSLEASTSQTRTDLEAALAAKEADLNRRLAQAQGQVETDLANIAQTETQAREQLRTALLQSNLSSDVITDLFNLQQSATIARNQYQQLLARVQDLNALANVQISDARIVSEALPPTSADSPNRRLILLLAGTAALGLGLLTALLNEYYIGGITSAAQLGNIIQARVPASVPAISGGNGDRLLADDIVQAPMSQYSESFRKLRLAIDTGLPPPTAKDGRTDATAAKGRVLLVCSALPGEGKTTSAIALARTYAVSGVRTLLVDCDLRKPSVGSYLGTPQQDGLIDYLVATEPPDDFELNPMLDPLSDLMVITAGTRSTRPTDQLLNSPRFSILLDAVRDSFEVVVLDSPPLIPVVDTRYLAQKADTAVLVVRFASTTQGEVREAASQVQEVLRPDVRLLGVLNRQARGTGARGYYKGDYGAYYGDQKG